MRAQKRLPRDRLSPILKGREFLHRIGFGDPMALKAEAA